MDDVDNSNPHYTPNRLRQLFPIPQFSIRTRNFPIPLDFHENSFSFFRSIFQNFPPILSSDPEFNNRKEKHATTGNICKYNNCKFIFVAARASSPLILRQICMAVSKQNERRSDVYRRAGITSVQRVTLTRRRKRRSRTHMPAGGLWPTKNVIKYGKEESVVK